MALLFEHSRCPFRTRIARDHRRDAAVTEGPGWPDWYVGKLARHQVEPEVHDVAPAVEYLRRERPVTLSMARRQAPGARRQDLGLIVIGHATELALDTVLQAARHALDQWIAGVQS